MSGRFYYYGGGGNSPYGWVAWVIGLAVFVGLGILLLPIVGAIVLILAAVAVAGFLFRVVADLLSPGNREGNDMPGDMPGSAEPPQSRQPNPAAPEPIACDPTLLVKDAVVIEEIDRENRSDNNRKNF